MGRRGSFLRAFLGGHNRGMPAWRRRGGHYQIRSAYEDDIPALARLKREVAHHAYARFPDEALREWEDRFCSEDYFRQRFEADEPTWFFLVGPGWAPLGMAALKVRGGIAYIGDVYVERQGEGIGQTLLQELLQRAWAKSFPVARADVFSDSERILRWLQSQGFEIVSGYREPSFGVWVHRLEKRLREDEVEPLASSERTAA